jgi:hypothetical protein
MHFTSLLFMFISFFFPLHLCISSIICFLISYCCWIVFNHILMNQSKDFVRQTTAIYISCIFLSQGLSLSLSFSLSLYIYVYVYVYA